MRVLIVKMRVKGVAIARRMLSDRYTVRSSGDLVILDVTDQGLRRPVKVARLLARGTQDVKSELMEPAIVWANEGRFTLAGFERLRNEAGQVVDYAQSWLCAVELAPAAEAVAGVTGRAGRNESSGTRG